MATNTVPTPLQIALEEGGKKIRRKKYDVLFQRGDKAFGMFLVLSGEVSLDFGVDSPASGRSYGPGALVGLPATVTRRTYIKTATVTEDAELGFWSPEALDALLHTRPELCKELLAIMGERLADNHEMMKALLNGDKQPSEQVDTV